jgi:hypothetical protein
MLALLLSLVAVGVFAGAPVQNQLPQGAIAFTAYDNFGLSNSNGGDLFAIVALQALVAPTEIFFTDREFAGTGSCSILANSNPNDGALKWTISTNIPAGTVVAFLAEDGPGTNLQVTHGTLDRVGSNFFNMGNNGDQIVAYQGSVDYPTVVLAAIDTFSPKANTELSAACCPPTTCLIRAVNPTADGYSNNFKFAAQYAGFRTGLPTFDDYRLPLNDFAANWNSNQIAFGPFAVTKARKRQSTVVTQLVVTPFSSLASVSGDPHVVGAHGIKFDFNGVAGGNYTLVSAPGFEITMQLAQTGPEVRYMTSMALLYRGTSVVIKPMKLKWRVAELQKHFDALNVKTTFGDWTMSVELCAGHTIKFTAMHSIDGSDLNFLDVALDVPGCHDAYGGILGQTYQCKYATEKFVWVEGDVATEEMFRIPELTTTTGAYKPDGKCADEQEYR